MKKSKIQIEYIEYDSESELCSDDNMLLSEAKKSLIGSYAPYSKFHVGAAVKLANGKIITGNNQENAAYPSGLCAERVALFYANASFPDVVVEELAIVASSNGYDFNDIITPCGSCRQVIAEIEKRQNSPIKIIMGSQQGRVREVSGIESLLPMMYYEDKLKKK